MRRFAAQWQTLLATMVETVVAEVAAFFSPEDLLQVLRQWLQRRQLRPELLNQLGQLHSMFLVLKEEMEATSTHCRAIWLKRRRCRLPFRSRWRCLAWFNKQEPRPLRREVHQLTRSVKFHSSSPLLTYLESWALVVQSFLTYFPLSTILHLFATLFWLLLYAILARSPTHIITCQLFGHLIFIFIYIYCLFEFIFSIKCNPFWAEYIKSEHHLHQFKNNFYFYHSFFLTKIASECPIKWKPFLHLFSFLNKLD